MAPSQSLAVRHSTSVGRSQPPSFLAKPTPSPASNAATPAGLNTTTRSTSRLAAGAGRTRAPTTTPAPAAPGSPAPLPAGAAHPAPALYWLRNDARLHDNPALAEAAKGRRAVLPVLVLDPRDFRAENKESSPPSHHHTPRFGPARAAFVLAAAADLRSRLRAAGSDLVVRVGQPEEVLPALARSIRAGVVVAAAEVAPADRAVEDAVRTALASGGGGGGTATGATATTTLHLVAEGGAQLYEASDLPPAAAQPPPPTFSAFAKAVEGVRVRPPTPAPGAVPPLPAGARVPAGDLPTVAELTGEAGASRPPSAPFQGGEEAGLARLKALAAAGGGGRSKAAAALGPWLAAGCLSARRVAAELGGGGGDSDGPWAPLAWRDYWRLCVAASAGGEGSGVAAVAV